MGFPVGRFCRTFLVGAVAALGLSEATAGVPVARGRCSIVVADGAADATRVAAEELQDLLGKVLGERPPILNDLAPAGTSLVLGDNAWSRAAKLDVSVLARDGFYLCAAEPNRVFICGRDDAADDLRVRLAKDLLGGGSEHATLFGVYAFLEREAGCRFYFPGEIGTVMPRKEALDVPVGTTKAEPYFTSRKPYMAGDGAWYAPKREKCLHWQRLRLETFDPPCCHGQNRSMLAERFAASHPEYFALLPDKRQGGALRRDTNELVRLAYHPMQICQSSKAWDEMYLDAVSYLRGEKPSVRGMPPFDAPKSGRFAWNGNFYAGRYVDVMPQDGMVPCLCAACQAAYRKDDPNYAVDLIWGNTARFARRLKEDGFKDAVVTQMAYRPYNALPDFDLPDNILVIVAQTGPWSNVDPARRDAELAQYRTWMEKTGRRVRFWTYPHKYGAMNIAAVPCLAPRAWGDYYRRAAPYVIGGFCESESDRAIYNYLNYYVFSRLAWDPQTDVEAVLAEHHRLMFGAAAAPMAKFYEALESVWTKEIAGDIVETSVGPVARVPDEYAVWTRVYSRARLDAWKRLIEEAAAAVNDDAASLARVRFVEREFLSPLARRQRDYADSISAEAALVRRKGQANRSVLENGDFETERGWTVYGDGAKASLDTDVKLTGRSSLRLESSGKAMYRQPVAGRIKPATKYRVSFFLKMDSVEAVDPKGGFGVYAELWDANWRYMPIDKTAPSGTRDWTYCEYTLTTSPVLAADAYFHLLVTNAKGTAWFDDVRFEEVPFAVAVESEG